MKNIRNIAYICGVEAVLTGDIVNSTKLGVRKREVLTTALKKFLLAHDFNHRYNNKESSIFFRGDSFQIALTEPKKVLTIGLLARMLTKEITNNKADIRFSIGLSQQQHIGNVVNESDGQAYWYSGRGLDNIEKKKMVIKTPNNEWNAQMNTTLLFADYLISGWSKEMSEVAKMTIEGKNQSEIGKELGISQSAVNQRLKNANYQAVSELISHFEKATEWVF